MFSPWSEDVHMWFGYNPCFNFCHFFHFVNFVIFWLQILWKCIDSGYLVSATLHTVLYRSDWNFTHVFSMDLEMCMWFGYNTWINFCHFFHFVNFVIFWPQILWKCIDRGYPVSAILYTISCLSLCNFAHLFSMVWRCACGLDLILQIIFVTFPLCLPDSLGSLVSLYYSHGRRLSVRCPSTIFKDLLLQNRWANQSQIDMEPQWDGGTKVYSRVWVTWPRWPPHPYMVKTLQKPSSPGPKGQWPCGLVCSIGALGPS